MNIEIDHKKYTEKNDRKHVVEVVSQGMDSEYWSILQYKLVEMLEVERKKLVEFSKHGITQEMLSNYNSRVQQIKLLEKVLFR